ncbi:MAG TPA: hypothetical protein PLP12_16995, partial [Verrucomicrobiota bacterium]|nr:hypothetical protein [Verrucomicrobiota bacterium]HQK02155.1 hypothetical protein [Verrucomicrobiota bacterium]
PLAYRSGKAEYAVCSPPPSASQLSLDELVELVELELPRNPEAPALAGWIGALNAPSTPPPASPPSSAGQLLGLEELLVLEDDA